MLYEFVKKTFCKENDRGTFRQELVIITGLHPWPEVYDSMNMKCKDREVTVCKISDGIEKFCIREVKAFRGVMANVYADGKIEHYSKGIVAYMKSVSCLPEVIKNFKHSLKD